MAAFPRMGHLRMVLVSVVTALALAAPAHAALAPLHVDSTADAIDATPGDGQCVAAAPAAGKCTLRAAIQEANALADPDTIDLPAGHYVLSIGGTGEDMAATGDLDLANPVTISGAGARTTTVDANGIDRVFELLAGVTGSISGVTIAGGSYTGGDGGGVEDTGTLTVSDSSIVHNSVGPVGRAAGGVDVSGSIDTLHLVRSLVARNRAASGGGINNNGTLTVLDSTIAGNQAGDSEHLGDGGGFAASAGTSTSIAYSTIVGNECWAGSACGGGINDGADLSNSILARNTESMAAGPGAPGSCGNGASGVVDKGHNVDDVDVNCNLSDQTSQRNVDPKLGPLANNGGPTDTFALLAKSPALNKGDNAACSATDQRGAPRRQFGTCDAGAFEAQRAPQIAALRVSPKTFRAAASGPTASRKRPVGATVSYTDSRAALTTFTILRRLRGIRKGSKCVAPPKKPARHKRPKRCTRYKLRGSFARGDVGGLNRFHFSGRLRGRKLHTGRYRLRAVARIWGVSGSPKRASFTITGG